MQQIEAFVNEVNEDSKTQLFVYKDPVNSHLAKKGYRYKFQDRRHFYLRKEKQSKQATTTKKQNNAHYVRG